MRTNFDFAPYRRSTVGFDRLFDLLESNARAESETYPPFDIEQDGDDRYRITLAVAGFRPEDIEVVAQNNQLTVTGCKADEADNGQYLHRGIATRAFERRFQLADFVVVQDASCDNLTAAPLSRRTASIRGDNVTLHDLSGEEPVSVRRTKPKSGTLTNVRLRGGRETIVSVRYWVVESSSEQPLKV